MKQTEKDLEKKLRDKAKALRRKSIQVGKPTAIHGVPDRIVLLPGEKIGFAEMKRPRRQNK